MLTPQEMERYTRQIIYNGFGEEGQNKLKKSKIVVAGAGGLGSPALIYLAAAGTGTIRIIDSDNVDYSNLNRQILHWTGDVGKAKVESAYQKLKEFNPEIQIEIVKTKIDEKNIKSLVSGFDLLVDALDNLETRYIINKYAVSSKIPFFHGAVSGFDGRAMTVIPGKTACLMCLYRGVTLSGKPPVFGVTPGIIACIQVTEVIKYLTGMGKLLENRMLVYDGINLSFSEIKVNRDPECPHCGVIDKL